VKVKTQDLVKWADSQQYHREPIPEENRRKITVSLINPPRDPLGHLVALNGIYKGEVIRSLDDPRVTDEARRQALEDLAKTALSGPLESIQFHFLIEGLTRSITHQMVRSRFSFFAQESLRFAVPEGDWTEEIPLPPSLLGLPEDHPQRVIWDQTIQYIAESYEALVNDGMPAEEARDLLPHAMPTRIHWVMDLRTLLLEAGKRTCTQAQFPWRIIFGEIAKALRNHSGNEHYTTAPGLGYVNKSDDWQYQLMADKIRPVCYQAGRCTFMAEFDRSCTIRERVEAFASVGVPSSEWHKNYDPENAYTDGPPRVGQIGGPPFIKAIQNHEWAADPSAARL
jgi:flavin-dependent thymidylate synthase